MKELKNYGNEDIVCMLIGNKADLKNYRSMKCKWYDKVDEHG